jgi:hypothetical protein
MKISVNQHLLDSLIVAVNILSALGHLWDFLLASLYMVPGTAQKNCFPVISNFNLN